MKTQIDIYSGFLSSGKTSLIKQALESRLHSKQRIVLVLCEAGEEDINEDNYRKGNVFIKRLTKDQPLESEVIKDIFKKYLPHRIIIEQNGMSSLEELLGILDERSIRKSCDVSSIINVVDCRTFDMLMNITGSNLIEQVVNSDIVILNYADSVSKDRLDNLKRTIKALNKSAEILSIELPEDYNRYLEDGSKPESGERRLKKPSDILFAIFFLLVTAYFIKSVLKAVDFNQVNWDLSWLQIVNTIFISILMQAFPFLLLGVLVSSVIQVFVSRDMIIKYFPKSKAASFRLQFQKTCLNRWEIQGCPRFLS